MAIVGPGTQQEVLEDIKPLLDGASEYEYVTILNPLTDDFAVRVAQDIPINLPMDIRSKTGLIQSDRDVIQAYGIPLKNPDFQGRKHISNDTIIKAGQTINLKGSEAQVAVRQLTNEILQREGSQRLMADPTLRKQIEERIIISRGSIQELMDSNLNTVQQQTTTAINKSNEVDDEDPFPGLKPNTESDAAGSGSITDSNTPPPSNPVGRPKKVR